MMLWVEQLALVHLGVFKIWDVSRCTLYDQIHRYQEPSNCQCLETGAIYRACTFVLQLVGASGRI